MLLPSIFGENLFDGWFNFPELGNIEKELYGRRADHVMKTDVHEQENAYVVDIDLPGFKKEEVNIELKEGYLTVSAAKGLDKDEKDNKGKLIRQERFAGAMQRSFYVGENLTEEDIKATFEHGVLCLTIAKKDAPKIPEKRTIMIEG